MRQRHRSSQAHNNNDNNFRSSMFAMSSWTTRCNHLLSRTRAVGFDGYQLASALVRKPSGESARDVMVAQARRSNNAVAVSFLKLDREVGLVKYRGLLGYLREKQVGQCWHPVVKRLLYGTNALGGPDPKKSPETKQVARVAFMITSTQRAELSERLGYEEDHIKRLKPIEASLILEHGVSPSQVDDKLVGLVKEYHDTLARQHQEARLEAALVETERFEAERLELERKALGYAMAETSSESESAGNVEQVLLLDQSLQDDTAGHANTTQSALPSTSEEGSTSSSDGMLWYEVVETNVSDGSATPIALYQSGEEADLCLELKQDFAERHAREMDVDVATTYFIRKTVK